MIGSVIKIAGSPLRRLACASVLVVAVVLAFVVVVGSASAATIPGQYIVVLKNGVSEPAVAAEHAKKGASIFHQYRSALNGYAAKLSDSALAAVRADKRVLFVAPDEEVHATATPCLHRGSLLSDQPSPQCLPWNLDRIDAELSSTRSGDGTGSMNVNVAVIDTGIDLEHQDLNVVGGKNCQAGKGFDDQNGHGTFVAGTIGAKDNGIGVVGVAPGAPLWSVRVLNKHGQGATSKVICGIDFVTATRTDADPSNDIAVANMSLIGGGSDDGNCGNVPKNDPLHRAICASTAAGVTNVAAAGNDATDFQTGTPAAYDEVLTATAMSDFDGQPGGTATVGPSAAGDPCTDAQFESDDAAASFSNFATLASDQAHTVAAPGVCVVSTYPVGAFPGCPTVGCYGVASGTSAASPHVAGTVALCIYFGSCAGLTPAQIKTKIVADARAYNLANPGYGFTGDPLHSPDPSKYYGYLIYAGMY